MDVHAFARAPFPAMDGEQGVASCCDRFAHYRKGQEKNSPGCGALHTRIYRAVGTRRTVFAIRAHVRALAHPAYADILPHGFVSCRPCDRRPHVLITGLSAYEKGSSYERVTNAFDLGHLKTCPRPDRDARNARQSNRSTCRV